VADQLVAKNAELETLCQTYRMYLRSLCELFLHYRPPNGFEAPRTPEMQDVYEDFCRFDNRTLYRDQDRLWRHLKEILAMFLAEQDLESQGGPGG